MVVVAHDDQLEQLKLRYQLESITGLQIPSCVTSGFGEHRVLPVRSETLPNKIELDLV